MSIQETRVGYLSLGSNVGEPERNLWLAERALESLSNLRVTEFSPVFWTEPQGLRDQPWFANMVTRIETRLQPLELLDGLHGIEAELGRVRTRKWGPRTLDIDILTLGACSLVSDRLTIPHPRMCERAFVLVPLAHLAPRLIVNGQPVEYWLRSLSFRLDGNRIWQAEGATS